MNRVFAGALLASALGCSSSSGGSHTVADASTDASEATFGASACGQCVATACAAAITACNGAPDCATYVSRLDACPLASDGDVDPTCASGCPQATSSTGQAAQTQLTACRTAGAGAGCAACGGDAGAEGGLLNENCAPDLDAANACNGCIHDKCCDVRLACLNDAECLALLDCELDCDDGVPDDAGPNTQPPDGGPYSCDEWCNAKANPSLDKWAQLLACTEVLCDGPSACGGDDACTTCVDASCSAEFVALNGTAEGYLFAECFGQCATTDMACQTACQSAYPSAQAAFSSLGTCTEQKCPSCAN
ncbi:MAG: hypothetical protein ABSE49_09025 [Polyangiaceae bacterium]